jgi:hypothetical protein
VLEQILSGEMTEIVVERIHEYLGTISENVKNGTIKLEEFIINKRLGKNPEEYPDAKSQPHVQVALRTKARGGTSKAGDVISYVFCTPETADVKGPAPKAAQADCAKSPDEVRKAEGELKIGRLLIIDTLISFNPIYMHTQTTTFTFPTRSSRPSSVYASLSKERIALASLSASVWTRTAIAPAQARARSVRSPHWTRQSRMRNVSESASRSS